MLTIRTAAPADVPNILELIRGIAVYEKMENDVIATPESIHNAMFVEGITKCLIAEEGEALVGFALYFYNYSTFIGTKGLYLEDLFLYPKYRKKGYGKKLMSALLAIAKAENCGRMEWTCLNWNAPSISFYESLGAQPMNEWTTWRLNRQDIERLAK